MYVSYKKFWKMLIDLDMSKTELIQKSEITTNVMAHMGKKRRYPCGVFSKNMYSTWLYF